MEKRSAKKKEPAYVGNIAVYGEYYNPRMGDIVTANIPSEDGNYTINDSKDYLLVKSSNPTFTVLTHSILDNGKEMLRSNNSYSFYSKYSNLVNKMKFVVLAGLRHNGRINSGDPFLFCKMVRVDLDKNNKIKHVYKEFWTLPCILLKYTGKRILDIRALKGTANDAVTSRMFFLNLLNNNRQDEFSNNGTIEDNIDRIISGVLIPRTDTKDNIVKSFISTYSSEWGSLNGILVRSIANVNGKLCCEKCGCNFSGEFNSENNLKVSLTKGKLVITCIDCGTKYELSFDGRFITGKKIAGPNKKIEKKPIIEHIVLDVVMEQGDEENDDEEDEG